MFAALSSTLTALSWTIIFVVSVPSFHLASRSIDSVHIDTDNKEIRVVDSDKKSSLIRGRHESGRFNCKNNRTWTFEKTVFELKARDPNVFHTRGTNLTITGSRSLELNVDGDLLINQSLLLNGRRAKPWAKQRFLGAFLPNTSSCCYVGAGPGAGFTFHGGGHGGSGGGSWEDVRNGVFYGQPYDVYQALAGGSTGSVIYDSDPGSGGGAIAINVKGKLTIASGVKISVNGFSVNNTSHPACAGGSSGGKIILRAKEILISGRLEAKGGNSGITSNYSYYCGDGGGGGVIYIHAYNVSLDPSSVDVTGGKGLAKGADGKISTGANFMIGTLNIDTTKCILQSSDFPDTLQGTIHGNPELCSFHFYSDVYISAEVNVTIIGHRGLSMRSNKSMVIKANIFMEINTACLNNGYETCLGGYNNLLGLLGPGSTSSYAAHGNASRVSHYGLPVASTEGGSVCKAPPFAIGGGSVRFKAREELTIDSLINADAWSQSGKQGASGGTIWLKGQKVHFGPNATLSAKGVDGTSCKGDGGIVYVVEKIKNAAYKRPVLELSGGPSGKRGAILDPISCQSINCSFELSASKSISQRVETTLTARVSHDVVATPTLKADATLVNWSALHISQTISPSSTIKTTTSSSIHQVKAEELSEQFKEIANLSLDQSNAVNILSKVNQALKGTTPISQADVDLSLAMLTSGTNKTIYKPATRNESESTAEVIMESMNEIISAKAENRIVSSSEDQFQNVAMTCVTLLENYGSSAAERVDVDSPMKISNKNLEIGVEVIDTKKPKSVTVYGKDKNSGDQIMIPRALFEGVKGKKSVPIVSVTLNSSKVYTGSRTVGNKAAEVASLVLSVAIDAKVKTPFKEPISLRFHVGKTIEANSTAAVGFWSQKSKNVSHHGWSYDGCQSEMKDNVVTARCNHMTSFAVLVQVAEFKISEADAIALNIITYVGCGISLFGLLLTFGTFISLESLDAERAAIHTNLVISLGIAQIIFLAGIEATNNKAACTAVAILLHYFFAAAFSWMFAEGLHLYNKVVSVFTQGSKIKFYCILGWGLPVVLVAVSAGIRPDGYGRKDACWISMNDGLIWAFVVPVLLVIVINLAILISVVRILMVSIASINSDQQKRISQIKSGIKAVGILVPILGLTWIFGILAVNEKTLALQYIFCILNSFQGLFIFLIHCIGNSEVRAAFKRLHEKHTLSHSIGGKSSGQRQASGSVVVKRQIGTPSDGSLSGNDSPKLWKASTDEISLHSLNCPDTTFK